MTSTCLRPMAYFNALSGPTSKNEFQPELHLPGAIGRRDLARSREPDRRYRRAQVHLVHGVKHFPAELQVLAFTEVEILHEPRIQDVARRSADDAWRRRPEVIERRRCECLRVKPQVRTRVV